MEVSKFLVNGEWRGSDRVRPVVNPYSNRTVGEVYQAGPGDIESAIRGAAGAFRLTRTLQSYQRAEILSQVAHEVERMREDFARLITAETGKPISFARSEVDRSIFTFALAAEEARRIEGSVLPLDLAPHSERRFAILRRFPLGPVGAITPFNFPLNLVVHKVAPAIASGNPVVLKPSSNAPMTALLLARIIHETGLPTGAFNVVPCHSSEADQLVTDERIKLVSFTGSPDIGWGIKTRAGKKKVMLELGGNAGVIVDKGTDLGSVVKRIALGSYGNAGQSCIAVQRIYVHTDIYDAFAEQFANESKCMVGGDPMDEKTVVGPMIEEGAARKVEEWIEEAVRGGAHVLCGGKRSGAVMEPTVLTNVKPQMRVSCREVFAPVVTLDRFSDFSEAVRQVNNSAFGLQAGVFTNNLNNVFQAYNELEVGGVIVNDYPTFRIDHMPYGGVKDSGFGREGIKFAIEEMTEMKLLAFNFI